MELNLNLSLDESRQVKVSKRVKEAKKKKA
jgi:hypothetical protein